MPNATMRPPSWTDSADDDVPSPFADLSEDERKMIRVLYCCGPQAALCIGPGPAGSRNTISIIGCEAGCLDLASVPDFLARLQRRGLIEFSPESLEAGRYAPVEDPDVLIQAGVTRMQTRRCSIRLTTRGQSVGRVEFPALVSAAQALEEEPRAR